MKILPLTLFTIVLAILNPLHFHIHFRVSLLISKKTKKPSGLFWGVLFWPHLAAHRILVPQPGIEPTPTLPAVGASSLNHWTTREVLDFLQGFHFIDFNLQINLVRIAIFQDMECLCRSSTSLNTIFYGFLCKFISKYSF